MTNTLFPGRPNYTGPTSGEFGLVHHDLLHEYSEELGQLIVAKWEAFPVRG